MDCWQLAFYVLEVALVPVYDSSTFARLQVVQAEKAFILFGILLGDELQYHDILDDLLVRSRRF